MRQDINKRKLTIQVAKNGKKIRELYVAASVSSVRAHRINKNKLVKFSVDINFYMTIRVAISFVLAA